MSSTNVENVTTVQTSVCRRELHRSCRISSALSIIACKDRTQVDSYRPSFVLCTEASKPVHLHWRRRSCKRGGAAFILFLALIAICTTVITIPEVEAQTGKIVFSGAVVVPTCAIPPSISVSESVLQNAPMQRQCPNGSAVPTSGIQQYIQTVVPLSGATNDRLLNYFYGYLAAESTLSAKRARLITVSYE